MWIDIFELSDGDIESIQLYWDKKVCYEATFVDEEGINEDGYVGDDDWGLGRHRIIEITDDKLNQLFMFVLNQYITNFDPKYRSVLISGKGIEEWLDITKWLDLDVI